MSDSDPTATRLQLLASGYNPLPNHDKAPALFGWNAPDYLTREIPRYKSPGEVLRSWARRFPDARSTGVRLENGLAALDGDVDDAELAGALWDAIEQVAPEILQRAPARRGGGIHKMAWFFRFEGEGAFYLRVSRRYARPEHVAAWKAKVKAAGPGERVPRYPEHKVEIYCGTPTPKGLCSKQFGVYGPHTTEGGEVKVRYRWDEGPQLADTPLGALPTLTKAQAYAVIDAFDAAAAQVEGFEAVQDGSESDGSGTDIYDIDPDTSRFEVMGEPEMVDYATLTELLFAQRDVRLTANFILGEASDTRDRCKALWSPRHDCVMVYDFKTAARHYPKDKAPEPDQFAEALKALQARPAPPPSLEPPPEPGEDADLHAKALWLTQTRAYCEGDDKVVRVYATRLDCGVAPGAFQRRYRHWNKPNPDKRFKRPVYATDLWEATPARRNLAGVRMRPDRPFPLYEEGGELFKNTYRRPVHPVGGDLAPFLAFLERFIPDPIEREWLLDWMAHKQVRPEIPGTSIFLVADTEDDTREGTYGVGRGLFFRALHQLYGQDYARSQDFSVLDGSSSQGAYTAWMHGSVLITVDEAQTSATGYRRGERKSVYEVLKQVIDPAPKLHEFKVKYGQPFDGMTYASFVVATNHTDAVAIPANDRRITVLRNGRTMARAETLAMVAWLENPANIGALSRLLATRELAGFDMFQPLATEAKAEMAELARSDVEEVLRDLIGDPTRGLVFTKMHIELAVDYALNGQWSGYNQSAQRAQWRGEFQEAWSRYCVGLKTPARNPRRVRMAGTQRKLFCFRVNHPLVRRMSEYSLTEQIEKWGKVDPVEDLKKKLGLNQKS